MGKAIDRPRSSQPGAGASREELAAKVRAKLAERGIDERDVSDAVDWARKSA